jgi:phosphodiesterase/alkaline phosphatase D-like protein
VDRVVVEGKMSDISFTDAWDGYISNKNRTLKTLVDNNIGNNIMMSGDSHLK